MWMYKPCAAVLINSPFTDLRSSNAIPALVLTSGDNVVILSVLSKVPEVIEVIKESWKQAIHKGGQSLSHSKGLSPCVFVYSQARILLLMSPTLFLKTKDGRPERNLPSSETLVGPGNDHDVSISKGAIAIGCRALVLCGECIRSRVETRDQIGRTGPLWVGTL
jgi:hypothetical protein